MTDIVRQTLQYQDPRRTLLLNAHNKDNYGRHRGTVLYGLQIAATGANTITIAPGAIYSPYGTKVFVDLSVGAGNTLTIPPSFLTTGAGARPAVLGIIATFGRATAIDPAAQPVIASRADLTTSTVIFETRVLDSRRDTGVPTLKLSALDPIGMVTAQDDAYSFSTENAGTQVSGAGGSSSLQTNEVLIGYIVLGVDPATGTPVNDIRVAGASIVQCKNLVEGLTDILGVDPLTGRNQTATEAYPANAALSQALTTGAAAGRPPSPAPHFGGPDDFTQWLDYKHPNFLRDGDNVVDALRRLDYILRLWMDRTGDQDLINKVQDGVVGGLPVRPTLDAIFSHFTGGTLSGTNANTIAYEQPADTSNLVLKDGAVVHALPSVVSTAVDTHKTALSALNRATWHMLKDVLGVTLSATEMRQNAVIDKTLNSSLQFTADHAQSLLVTPTSAARTDYLYTDTLFAAIATLAERSRAGTSVNLLLNSNLARGPLATPNNWALSSATRGSAVGLNGAFPGTMSVFSVLAGGFIQQSVALDATQSTTAVSDIFSALGRVGAALLYQTTATTFTLEVETSDGTTVTGRWQVALPAAASFQHQSFVGRLAVAGGSCRMLTFRIKNTGGVTAAFSLLGAAMGLGAQAAGFIDPLTQQFMPRDGALPALADVDFGNHKGINVVAGVAGTDAANVAQMNTADTAEAAARVAADAAEAAARVAADTVLTTAVSQIKPVNFRIQYTTPGDATYTVPANVSGGLLYIGLAGGGGGGGGYDEDQGGGNGGTGEAGSVVLITQSGDTLQVRVAGGGAGGAYAGQGSSGGGGGGRTRIGHYRGATLLGERVVAGGGGGGGGTNTSHNGAHDSGDGGATGAAGAAGNPSGGVPGGDGGFGWPTGTSLAGGIAGPSSGPSMPGGAGASGSTSYVPPSGTPVYTTADYLFSGGVFGFSGGAGGGTTVAGANGFVIILAALY